MNDAQTVTEQPASATADFEAFVAARSTALWRSAYLLTGDPQRAEDLLQTALVKAWRRWDKITRREAAEAYVRAALVSTYTDWWRRRWNGEVSTGELPERATAVEATRVEVRRDVLAALALLPRGQRAVVVLRYFDDLTEAQTADDPGRERRHGEEPGLPRARRAAHLPALRDRRRRLMSDTDRLRDLLAQAAPAQPDLDPSTRAAAVARRGRTARNRDRALVAAAAVAVAGRRRPAPARGGDTPHEVTPAPPTPGPGRAVPGAARSTRQHLGPVSDLGDVVAVRSCPVETASRRRSAADAEPLDRRRPRRRSPTTSAPCRATSCRSTARLRQRGARAVGAAGPDRRRPSWSPSAAAVRRAPRSASTGSTAAPTQVVAAFEGNLARQQSGVARARLPDRRPARRRRADTWNASFDPATATAGVVCYREDPMGAQEYAADRGPARRRPAGDDPRRPGGEPRTERGPRQVHRHRPAAAARARGRGRRPGRLRRRRLHRCVRGAPAASGRRARQPRTRSPPPSAARVSR